MRKIIDILWNRNAEPGQLPDEPRISDEFSAEPAISGNDAAGMEEVTQLGQENEAFRQLFMDAQRRIDDLEGLRAAFGQLAAPLERSLRQVELEKVENASIRANLSDARARNELMRGELVRFEKRVDVLETEKQSLHQDLRSAKESIAVLENSRIELTQDLTQTRNQIMELERQVVRAADYERSLVNDNQTLRDMIITKDAQITQNEAHSVRLSESVSLLEGDNRGLNEALALKLEEFTRATRRLKEVEHELDSTRNRLSHTKTLLNETKNERKAISDQFDDLNSRYQTERSALSMKIDGLQSRSTLGERLLAEARNSLIARTEELRVAERKLVDASVTAAANDQKMTQIKLANENLERQIRELEHSRSTLIERANALTKNLKARDSALAKLDDRIPVLMGRIDQLEAQIESNRVSYQTRIDELGLALETERMERAVAEGALGMARKSRGTLHSELARSSDASHDSSVDGSEAVLDLSKRPVQQRARAKAGIIAET
ncbi:MAG: hypothetical protein ACKOC1_11140 [Hyphomicrobiales bacterium]